MAGGERRGAEFAGRRQKVGKLDGLVAGHAGDRRLAGHVALGKGIDDGLAKALLVIQHVMRDAQRLGDAPGIGNVPAGAAGAAAVGGGAVVVELQRHADDVVAFALQQAGDHGGVDTAGHGDDDARVLRPSG